MKKLRLRSLALLLTLALLATMLPMSALAEGLDGGGESLEEALNVDTTYYEVAFALPDGLSEEEAAQIALPEPVLLPADTLLYALAEPTREDYSFAGWYYDAALTQPADGGDAVTRNLTLYPSFAPIQNYDDEFRINYISNQEVAPDFPIEVVAHGLSEDQLRQLSAHLHLLIGREYVHYPVDSVVRARGMKCAEQQHSGLSCSDSG